MAAFPAIADITSRFETRVDLSSLEEADTSFPENGEDVTAWNDAAGNNNMHVVAGGYEPQYRAAEASGHGAVEFDRDQGVEGAMLWEAIHGGWDPQLTTPYHCTFAMKWTSPADNIAQNAIEFNTACGILQKAADNTVNWKDTTGSQELMAAADGNWHIYAINYTGTGTTEMFLDGVSIASKDIGGAGAPWASFSLGSAPGPSADFMTVGFVLYSRALDADEVMDLAYYFDQQYELDAGIYNPDAPATPPAPTVPDFPDGISDLISRFEVQIGMRTGVGNWAADGEDVEKWEDLAGSNDMILGSAGLAPAYSASAGPNHHGALVFATNDYLKTENNAPLDTPFTGPCTTFVVAKVRQPGAAASGVLHYQGHDTPGEYTELVTVQADTKTYWGSAAKEHTARGFYPWGEEAGDYLRFDEFVIYTMVNAGDGTSWNRSNGIAYSADADVVTDSVCTGFAVGASLNGPGNDGADMDICALIIFDKELNEEEMQQVEYYLDQRYQLGHECPNPYVAYPAAGHALTDLITNRYFRKAGTQDIVGNPDNLNDGRDPLGLALVNATYDHTGNVEGERHLLLAAAFAAYDWAPNDRIYLMNAVGGVADGLYRIEARVDDDAILLSENDGLTADSTADVDSSNGPWKSEPSMADQLTAGNVGIHCADVMFSGGASTINYDTNTGTVINPIIHRGGSARGVEDGKRMHIGGPNLDGVSEALISDGGVVGMDYIWHENFVYENNGWYGVEFAHATSDGWGFRNCEFVGCHMGLYRATGIVRCTLIDCEFHHNEFSGLSTASSDGTWACYGCSFHHNGTDGGNFGNGVYSAYGGIWVNCVFYKNAQAGLWATTWSPLTVINCVFDSNGTRLDDNIYGSGLYMGGATDAKWGMLYNNIFSNNGGWGVYDKATNHFNGVIGSNWFFNNTQGNWMNQNVEAIAATGDWIQEAAQYVGVLTVGIDPGFVSIADDLEDYRLRRDSPCKDAGLVDSTPSLRGAIAGFGYRETFKLNLPVRVPRGMRSDLGINPEPNRMRRMNTPRNFGLLPINRTEEAR